MIQVFRSPQLQEGGQLPPAGQEERYNCVHWHHGATEPQYLSGQRPHVRPQEQQMHEENQGCFQFQKEKKNRHTCPSILGNEVLTDTCGSNQNIKVISSGCVEAPSSSSGASSTLYWQLGAVWSWRRTSELLSGRLVWSIPEISVTDGTLVTDDRRR